MSTQGGKKQPNPLKDLPDAEDEATPNAALVVFLQCLTGLVPGLSIQWMLNRASFTPVFRKGQYNTVTDGVLQVRVSKRLAPLSIVEVKTRMRQKRTPAIIMQEGCEPPARRIQQPPSAHRPIRYDIFLILAAYTQAYKGYLAGEEAKADSFLVMKTFGPWRTCDHAHMKEIRHIGQMPHANLFLWAAA